MNRIGRFIARTYYTALWYLGFRDDDNDPHTIEGLEKITWMLRRIKQRWGVVPWWAWNVLLFTFLAWQMFTYHRWYLVSVWVFEWWLLGHLLEAPNATGPSAALRQRFVAARMRRRFDSAHV